MSQPKNNIAQYLQRYSHGVDTQFIQDWFIKSKSQAWDAGIILPVCGEMSGFLYDVFDQVKAHSCLLIVCVNRPEKHAKTHEWQQQNQQFIADLNQSASQIIESEQPHKLLLDVQGMDCLLLDFNEQPFDDNKGVGLARKIAADTLLQLIALDRVVKPWIFSTDADVKLPTDYLSVVDALDKSVSALSLKFEHQGQDEKALLYQMQYDFKLKYYQQGVYVINPMYAYIPLGSTLVINAESYAQVRGFPARSGGEDFYILNKLAKVGQVWQPKNEVILIKIRYSDRVPFGTGPAIKQLADTKQSLRYYHPDIFFVLKDWRVGLLGYFTNRTLPSNDFGLNQNWQIETVLNQAIKQYKNEKQWYRFVDEWFDAFRILKSVHFLSEEFSRVEMERLKSMPTYRQLSDLTEN